MVIAYGYWLSITYQLGYTSPVEEIIFIQGRCGMVLTCLEFLTVSKRARDIQHGNGKSMEIHYTCMVLMGNSSVNEY